MKTTIRLQGPILPVRFRKVHKDRGAGAGFAFASLIYTGAVSAMLAALFSQVHGLTANAVVGIL